MTSNEYIPIAVGWRVIVEKVPGKRVSDGGIALDATIHAQQHLMYMAKVVSIGEAAFKARTKGGIDMNEWVRVPQVGDYVIVPAYGGQPVRRTEKDGKERPLLTILNDTDIIAIIEDPSYYYSWVDG